MFENDEHFEFLKKKKEPPTFESGSGRVSGLRGRKVSRPHSHHDPGKINGEGREERDADYLRAILCRNSTGN